MTSTLLELLLLSQTEGSDNLSTAARWLYAVGQGGTLLFPAPDGTMRPISFASLGLGVDHAR